MKTLEFEENCCPTNPGSRAMFLQAIAEYLRTGDPDYLPPGVRVRLVDAVSRARV